MVAQESRREKTKPKGTAASWEPPDPSHRRPHSPGGERIISEQSLLLKVGPSNLGIETDDRNSGQREQLPPPTSGRGGWHSPPTTQSWSTPYVLAAPSAAAALGSTQITSLHSSAGHQESGKE